MKNKTDKSLFAALQHCSLTELPAKDTGEDIWIKAIAKVLRRDGYEYYAYAEKDTLTGEPKIVKNFGSIAAMVKVVEYYPFSFLKAKFMPVFKTKGKEERVAYLSALDRKTDYSKLSLKELNKTIVCLAISNQLKYENNRNKKVGHEEAEVE